MRNDLFEEDKTPLGLIPPKDVERMKDRTWRSLIKAPGDWVDRHWDDALNAHLFFKADPL